MTTPTRAEYRRRFADLDTSNVADVLDEMGIFDQGLDPSFAPYPAGSAKLAGFAYTIRGQMTPFPMGGDAEKMRACQGIADDEVSVWAGDGEGTCYFGELIAIGMMERGCVGALVDGGVRDIRWFEYHGFPVFARYRSPVQSIGRWKVNACQIPVFLKGATSSVVRVEPGDFVVADSDGGIVIPARHLHEVLERTEALTRKESLIREELSKGLALEAALAKFGHV